MAEVIGSALVFSDKERHSPERRLLKSAVKNGRFLALEWWLCQPPKLET